MEKIKLEGGEGETCSDGSRVRKNLQWREKRGGVRYCCEGGEADGKFLWVEEGVMSWF